MKNTPSSPVIRGIGVTLPQTPGDPELLEDSLETLVRLGCDFAEIPLYAQTMIVNGGIQWPQVESFRRLCSRHPLRLTVHGPVSGNLMDDAHREAHAAVIRATIEIASALGSDTVVVHAGRTRDAAPDIVERLMGSERDAMRNLGDFAAGFGIRLALENLFAEPPYAFAANVERLGQQIAAIDHEHVMGTLDFSHAFLQTEWEGIDYADAVTAYAPYVGHLHVHDSFGKMKSTPTFLPTEDLALGQGDLHLPIGWGAIPFDAVAPRMRVRRGTTLIAELPYRYWSELEETVTRARAIAASLEYCSESLAAD